MQTITLLHASKYMNCGAGGFEKVRFPVRVQAEPYRYGKNLEFTMDSLMCVPNEELIRIGYTGPLIDGGLHFGDYDKSFRHVSAFAFWNALKASRDVGSLPA